MADTQSTDAGVYAASYSSVKEAHDRIRDAVTLTPVMTSGTMDELSGRELFFKCENFQKVGAFKFRGATNAVRKYAEAGGKGPLVTHSSGNHAQALALAAKQAGMKAFIVMPSNAPVVKVDAVKGYGATVNFLSLVVNPGSMVIPCKPIVADRETTKDKVMAENPGAAFFPPYNHPDIISGQGTLVLELLSQVPDGRLDALVVPVGGGGMLSGCCIAAKAAQPDIRIFAAEPLGADDVARSMKEGKLVPQTDPRTIADGLLTSMGDMTWPIIRDHVEEVVTVTEEEIVSAMKLVFTRMKLVIEPSAAVGVAAVLSEKFRKIEGIQRVGIVLCGGNVDIQKFSDELVVGRPW